jgi:4-hydroxybenzoate polyprenyltransferase
MDPFDHYVNHGRYEGRTPNERSAWNRSGLFTASGGVDAAWYLEKYPDLSDTVDAAEHYALVGWREGRDPNRNFSTTGYLVRYPDIVKAGINPLLHYLEHGQREGRTSKLGLGELIRAAEWWPTKFSWLYGVVYATALTCHSSLIALWPLLLLTLAALTPAAAYAAVLNDLTDRDVDAVSGKANRLHGKSRAFVARLLAACVVPGCVASVVLLRDPALLGLYLGTWVAFTFYSMPPVRLKIRGFGGVVADAAGAHLFPTMFLIVAVYHWLSIAIDPVWFAAVTIVSSCYGLRGILSHQVGDRENDDRASVQTFVRKHTPKLVRTAAYAIVFPLEAGALTVLLWRLAAPLPVLFLAVYLIAEWRRSRTQGTTLTLSFRDTPVAVTLYQYYNVYFPLALIVSASLTHRADLLIAVGHVSLFFVSLLRSGMARQRERLVRAIYPELPTFRRSREGSEVAP